MNANPNTIIIISPPPKNNAVIRTGEQTDQQIAQTLRDLADTLDPPPAPPAVG